jgi:hypothetical protein
VAGRLAIPPIKELNPLDILRQGRRAMPGWRSAYMWRIRLRRQLAILFLIVSGAGASACPLCYEAARQAITADIQVDVADRVVLAATDPAANEFRIGALSSF